MKFELKKCNKSFDEKQVLKNISLTIPKGKITAIVGPSGSGKTTLLRLLNLLDKPTKGQILIDGCNPCKKPKKEQLELSRNMVMVFQNPTLFRRTVSSNIMYGQMLRGVDRSTAREKAHTWLDKVNLLDKIDQYAPTLSAGEAQRMAFARAVVFHPRAMLLDEFTANLDPGNVDLLEHLVQDYKKETGGTIIIATHNLYQAKRISDKTIVLFNGSVLEEGNTSVLFSKPKKEMTKKFLSGELAW